MDEAAIYSTLQGVFNDVFMDEVTLTPGLSAGDVAGWDSFTILQLFAKDVINTSRLRARNGRERVSRP
ncbi:MAG TPA: hypothetical protein DEA08_04175 [Planctomycetes bacterium]|nr:hypothetical protein [Planctomycetota bacterium]